MSTTQTTLGIAKESVAGLPVPGLEAAIGGLLKILTVYQVAKDTLHIRTEANHLNQSQGMKANEEAIKVFNATIVRLNDNVTLPLNEAIAKQPDFIDEDLQKRLGLLARYVRSRYR